jgi:hypothetical protein
MTVGEKPAHGHAIARRGDDGEKPSGLETTPPEDGPRTGERAHDPRLGAENARQLDELRRREPSGDEDDLLARHLGRELPEGSADADRAPCTDEPVAERLGGVEGRRNVTPRARAGARAVGE